jgi:hypothetical protein
MATAVMAYGLGEKKSVTPMGYFLAAFFFLQFFKIWPFSR